MKSLNPKKLYQGLIAKGYSEVSASIITSQVRENRANRNKWGTEEQTRKDVEQICNS